MTIFTDSAYGGVSIWSQPATYVWMLIYLAMGVTAICALVSAFFSVQQQSVAVVQRFGKFVRMASPGLNFKVPFIDQVAGTVGLRVSQLDVGVETKTKDNVFVTLKISVQFFVEAADAYNAFYKLSNPGAQIKSYIFDVVRATVPTLDLDDVFEKKEEIAVAIKRDLSSAMKEFGYRIVQSLVTDIEPNAEVKAAMNEINASQRLRVAAAEKGEAEKVLRVKAAEAEAESKKLQGKGIADQRKAIVDGLRESVEQFQKGIEGATARDVMDLVLITQYFDTLKDIGASAKSNAIFVEHSPSAVSSIAGSMRNALVAASEAVAQ
jgi:regulator of protease activity HflC (stomatin/prohibitin superfamily)